MKPTPFPLCWPPSQPRTKRPSRARFAISAAAARNDMLHELRLLHARAVIISTNVPLRRDGLPYADGDPSDAGVAVYFEIDGEEHNIACDAWDLVKDNMRAIGKTVEALRGIERWGSSTLMKRVFSAFRMLPENGARPWWQVLGVDAHATADEIRSAHRRLAFEAHPDRGGSHERMAEINAALDAAQGAA